MQDVFATQTSFAGHSCCDVDRSRAPRRAAASAFGHTSVIGKSTKAACSSIVVRAAAEGAEPYSIVCRAWLQLDTRAGHEVRSQLSNITLSSEVPQVIESSFIQLYKADADVAQ